eukprot:TRINITY_DN3942_c0_g1_i1.p1 TRINITY_DN3942_c0_g1~~TRINITY_DN3942_c0_g1_i1.p1  ORF type:complete len:549 (-),score=118.68 TRINITY_DN3942_c0_g1_i1:262-1863(-)
MARWLACIVALAVLLIATVVAQEAVVPTAPQGPFVYFANFDDDKSLTQWKHSTDAKYTGHFSVTQPSELNGLPGNVALTVPEPFKHYGVVSKFKQPLDNKGKTLVVQYEVRLTAGLDCGGAYMKLLSATEDFDETHLVDSTPYSIMFGPDKCGHDSKVHFIFRHKNPVNGIVEEKHLKNPPAIKTDKISHLYTLIVRPDQTFEILIDQDRVSSGSLLEDFKPAVNPPKEIDDPTDKKPSDWVDEAKIPDPTATKPDDWDESAPIEIEDAAATKPEDWLDDGLEFIPDPEAEQPEEWDEESDGQWETPVIPNPACQQHGCGEWKRPKIRNPAYKGKWTAPLIDNPAYKGEWHPRQIPNPAYFVDNEPSNFTPIAGIAFELWTINGGIMFDNILVTNDESVASNFATQTFGVRHSKEAELLKASLPSDANAGIVQRVVNTAQVWIDEKPALVVAAVVTPILLIVSLCVCLCRGSKKTPATVATPAQDPAAAPAATPAAAATEDTPAAAEDSEDSAPAQEPAAEKTTRKRKPTKAQ